jgi:hypothetical protein
MNTKETSSVRREAQKEALLEQLSQIPIVGKACARAKISRAQFYRLREQPEFKARIDSAIEKGIENICELCEDKTISLIRKGNLLSMKFWLQAHSPRYSRKLEISGKVNVVDEKLTEEEEQILKEALRVSLPQNNTSNANEDE